MFFCPVYPTHNRRYVFVAYIFNNPVAVIGIEPRVFFPWNLVVKDTFVRFIYLFES